MNTVTESVSGGGSNHCDHDKQQPHSPSSSQSGAPTMDINEGHTISNQKRAHAQLDDEVAVEGGLSYQRRRLDCLEGGMSGGMIDGSGELIAKRLQFGQQQIKDDISPPASLDQLFANGEGGKHHAAPNLYEGRHGPSSLYVEVGSTSSKATNAKSGEECMADQQAANNNED